MKGKHTSLSYKDTPSSFRQRGNKTDDFLIKLGMTGLDSITKTLSENQNLLLTDTGSNVAG